MNIAQALEIKGEIDSYERQEAASAAARFAFSKRDTSNAIALALFLCCERSS